MTLAIAFTLSYSLLQVAVIPTYLIVSRFNQRMHDNTQNFKCFWKPLLMILNA